MICRLLMVAGLTAAVAGTAALTRTATTLPTAPPSSKRAVDLEQLRHWMTLEQSFSPEVRARAELLFSEYARDAAEYTNPEFYMAVRRLVALAENGHSNVSSVPIYRQFGLLPLRAYWFSDGLYVVRAHRAQEALLGARITGIEDRSLEQMERQLMEYHGGNRAAFRRFAAMPLMLSPALLHAIGLAASPDELTLDLVGPGEEAFKETVASEPGPVRAGGTAAWRLLVAAPLPGEDGDWLAVRERDAKLPLYFRDGAERFRFRILRGGIGYIQLRANIGRQGDTLRDFTDEVQRQIASTPPRAIILDNRQNGGGDLTRSADFALGLPALVREGGKVYVLTDHGTFSAGIYTSFFPKAADPARAVIVGEHVGDFSRFWAEAPGAVILPESGIRIGYAKQMHDIANGCHDPAICHMTRFPRWNIGVGSLDPDIPVGTTFADFEAGVDPALDRALSEIGKSS